ncbi:male sterility protein-domain-containing protein [Chaetomidium leptoderma]|uniref:Male sterility protein-domain-containing protein n=1 Tax=Chaetomidium leptoderma TaxID=669021 RepID=A0AAN6ZUG5_9PEZI|nr:male sterility protein-domain-containing protein [Chaetomidium leptoderma]
MEPKQSAVGDVLDYFVSRLQLPRTGAGPDGESSWTVILTGSTGSLGTRILSELQALPKLRKIYCLNRSEEAEKAQITTLRKCGLPPPNERVTFIKASFESPRLGLGEQTWQQLASETTLIIHNAWPVNFLTALEGFKPHLEALRYLLILSYESRHRPPFLYVSSLGIAYSADLGHIPEEIFRDFSGVNGGYPQSKYIAERMVEAYARSTGCPTAVLRVGQVAGPVRSGGIWPHREWFPTLLRASSHIKALPSTLGPHDAVDWIPVDILSRIIVEIAEHVKVRTLLKTRPDVDCPLVFNIANPKTVSFGKLLPYLDKVTYKTVTCKEWVRLLQESVAENPQIPGAKLLGFYEAAFTTRKASIETVTCNMMTASETARGLQAVNGSWMVRWLDDWCLLAPREHL